MKNFIPVHLYTHTESITMNGVSKSSYYNHNFYRGTDDNDIIFEECNDDNFFSYSRVKGINEDGKLNLKYLGAIDSEVSIFDESFTELENGEIAIIDTDIC